MAGEILLTGSGTFFPKPPLIENRSGAGIVGGQQPRYPEVQLLSAHNRGLLGIPTKMVSSATAVGTNDIMNVKDRTLKAVTSD